MHGSGGPQVDEVTRLGGVKKPPPLRVILQPRHPGVHIFKITEWSLSTYTRTMLANLVFWRLMLFYTHVLLLLQPSVLWLSIATFKMFQSHRQNEFCSNLMYSESDDG